MPSEPISLILGVPAWLMTRGIRVVLISLVLLAAYRSLRRLIDRGLADAEGLAARRATLRMVLRAVLRAFALLLFLLLVLPEFGFAVGPLIASLGIVGLALTFGTQTLVKDLVAGFFLLAEDLCRVGEEIEVKEVRGRVERLKVRTLVVRTEDGSVVFIPYGEITALTNYSRR